MGNGSENRILLKGSPIRKEGDAASVITPGMLLTFDGSGDLIPHDTANGISNGYFCLEEDFTGDGINTDYAAADRVQYVVARRGDEVNALLADGNNVAVGDPLSSNGSGALQAITVDATTLTGAVVGYALEALNNTSGDNARLQVEAA